VRPVDPRLLRHAPGARAGAVVTVGLSGLRAALAVAQALLLAHMLAAGFEGSGWGEPVRAPLGWLLAVVVLRSVLAAAQDVVSARAAAATKLDLRRAVLARLTELGPGWLSGHRGGELATLVGSGVESLDAWFRLYLPQLVLSVAVPGAVLVVLAATDWRSAVIMAVSVPLLPLFLALVGMHTRAQTERQWQALSGLGGHFLDVVTGLSTLRVFGRAQAQVGVLRRITTEHRLATMATLRTAFLSALVLELVATLAVAVVAVSLGFRLLQGQVTLETALMVLLLAPEAFLPLRAVGTAFHAALDGVVAAEAAFAVLEMQVPDLARGRLHAQPGRLVLEGVTVRRDGRAAPALDACRLDVQPGEHVALVGHSGAGKSTVLALLLGLLRPDQGRVLVDGTDLRDVDLEHWQSRVAWVPQAPYLFSASIADNIRLGRPDATDAEVREAAEAAHVAKFVDDLPHGYATLLGERGEGLSVGQQRRVALARAFLRDAPLVLLDEPTAGLDGHSESLVAAALERLCTGRTVVLATHRLELAGEDYRVVRLDGGRAHDGGLVLA
jgi:thiol reductant ABC exporter CydD subunit